MRVFFICLILLISCGRETEGNISSSNKLNEESKEEKNQRLSIGHQNKWEDLLDPFNKKPLNSTPTEIKKSARKTSPPIHFSRIIDEMILLKSDLKYFKMKPRTENGFLKRRNDTDYYGRFEQQTEVLYSVAEARLGSEDYNKQSFFSVIDFSSRKDSSNSPVLKVMEGRKNRFNIISVWNNLGDSVSLLGVVDTYFIPIQNYLTLIIDEIHELNDRRYLIVGKYEGADGGWHWGYKWLGVLNENLELTFVLSDQFESRSDISKTEYDIEMDSSLSTVSIEKIVRAYEYKKNNDQDQISFMDSTLWVKNIEL